MAIFTPRGLKIGLDNRYCFALMQRLYPKTSPFKVLKTAEGFECMKDIYVLFTVIIVILLKQNYLVLGFSVFSILVIEHFIERFIRFGANINFFSMFILKLSILYSYVNGFFIFTGLITITLYFTIGLYGVIAYFIALIVADFIKSISNLIIDLIMFKDMTKIYIETLGTVLTKSERDFFNSYFFYSKSKEIPFDVNESELDKENWKPVFNDLNKKWPVITKRITWE